jgi:hypothetical protein
MAKRTFTIYAEDDERVAAEMERIKLEYTAQRERFLARFYEEGLAMHNARKAFRNGELQGWIDGCIAEGFVPELCWLATQWIKVKDFQEVCTDMLRILRLKFNKKQIAAHCENYKKWEDEFDWDTFFDNRHRRMVFGCGCTHSQT